MVQAAILDLSVRLISLSPTCIWCRIDGDSVLMRDVYPVTVQVGYQFAMRWMNAHIFYLKKGSPLSKRILNITQSMPLNHPEFRETVVEKVLLSRLLLKVLPIAFTAAGSTEGTSEN